MRNIFSIVDGKQWKESFIKFVWEWFASIIPMLLTLMLLLILGKNPSLYDISRSGQFVIYSAVILGYASYVLFSDFKTAVFIGRRTFGVSWLVLFVITILFLYVFVGVESNKVSINQKAFETIRVISIFLYVVSIVLHFLLSTFYTNSTIQDIRNGLSKEYRKLEESFDKGTK